MTDELRSPEERIRRGEHRFRLAISGLISLAVVVIVVGIIMIAVLLDLRDQATQDACSNRLTSDAFAAAGRALAAPPAPNARRDAAVNDIIRASDRLAESDRICARGVPAPMIPTPPSSSS